VHQDIDLGVVSLNLGGALADGEAIEARVPLVGLHVLGHVRGRVEDGVERVDLGNLHLRAVSQDHILVELRAAERQTGNARSGVRGKGCREPRREPRSGYGQHSSIAPRVLLHASEHAMQIPMQIPRICIAP
jgi:hypothetical protein